jgi:hypothetical protein
VKFNSFNVSNYPSIIVAGGLNLQGCGPAYKQEGDYGKIDFFIHTKSGVGPLGRGTGQILTPKIATGEWHLLTVTKGPRSLSLAVDDGAPIIATLNNSIATSDFIMKDTGPIQLKDTSHNPVHSLDGEVKSLCIHS